MLTPRRKKQLVDRIKRHKNEALSSAFEGLVVQLNAHAKDCIPFLFSLVNSLEGKKVVPPGYVLHRLREMLSRKISDPHDRDKNRILEVKRCLALVDKIQKDILKLQTVKEVVNTRAHQRAAARTGQR